MEEDAIFLKALQLTSPEARGAFVEQACGGDEALRRGVEQLLDAHELAAGFLLGAPSGVPMAKESPATLGLRSVEGPGEQIGPYKLLQQLGEGGMGTVFLARQDTPVKRLVALKIIKAGMDTRQVIARFEAERQALAMMDHPNIAKVLDVGATDTGRPYFVMELVRGVPITTFCDEQHLSTRERLELFVPVCQAVQHAHQKGVVHRDLKPSNILVPLVDGRPVAKVIDFGVAKAMHQRLTDLTVFTEFGQIVGTLEYMSPEQARLDQLDVDTRSDIYSLGVLLYELLTGSPPFSATQLRGAAFDEMLRIIRQVAPPKPSTRLSSSDDLPSIAARRKLEPHRLTKLVSGELDWIVMKCLEKERGRRYATANGLAADVERYLHDEPVVAGPPSATYRFRKFARRNKMVIVTMAVVAASLIAGLIGTAWQAIQARHAEQTALEAGHKAADEAAVAKAVNQFLQDDLLGMAGASDQLRAGLKPSPDLKLTTLVDRALANVDERFSDQPRVKAEVQNTLGKSLVSIGRYADAAALFEQVRRYREQALGPEAPETLTAMNNLAESYRESGRYDTAVALGEQTLAVRRKILGPEHPDTLRSMGNLANTLVAVGQVDRAVALHEQALQLSRRILGTDHADTLVAMGSLAETYRAGGEISQTLLLHEQALELSRRIYGPEHPETLTALNNVAIASEDAGEHDKALALLEQALDLARTVLGPDHPDTLMAMNNLAGLCREAGQYPKALALQEDLIPRMRKVLGLEHPDTVLAMGSLANTYTAAGQPDKAIEIHEQVLAMRRMILGPEHPHTLLSIDNLAHAHGSAGQFDKALPLHEQALELQRKVLGPNHPDTLRTMSNLGFVLWYTRQWDRSIATLEETLKLQAAALPPDHPNTVRTKAHLGRAYRDAGRVAEALPLLDQAYRKSGDQPTLRWTGDELLKTYVLAGKSAEATALVSELLTTARAELPPNSQQLAGALSRAAFSLLQFQAWDEAEPIVREALAIREQQTPEDWRTFNTRSMLGEVLLATQRFADAEPLLVQGYEGMQQRAEQIPAEGKMRLTEALQRLVKLYESWQKPEEAATWRAELEARKSAAVIAK